MVFEESEFKGNKNQFWYDIEKKCFFLSDTDIKIKISAGESLVIIGASTRFLWDIKTISQRIIWASPIDERIISNFLDEYSSGHLEEVIAWICDNNIECSNKDKFDYLARYNVK